MKGIIITSVLWLIFIITGMFFGVSDKAIALTIIPFLLICVFCGASDSSSSMGR